MSPPDPSERAAAIVSGVARQVELDLTGVRGAVASGVEAPADGLVWERAECLAAEVIASHAADELLEQCRRGFAEAHDAFLRTAAACVEASSDLDRNGADAWIARAIRHRLAFDVAWDSLAGRDGEPSSLGRGAHGRRRRQGADGVVRTT